MIVENLTGSVRIRIVDGTVAAGAPRAVGEVLEVGMQEGYELLALGKAELFIEAPKLLVKP